MRDLNRGRALLGSALLWVAASQDGSTLFWAYDRAGQPLAQRWGPSNKPWKVALPLEGGEGIRAVHCTHLTAWIT